jgi:cephalosporin-C deacetylase-like acetyl esterase
MRISRSAFVATLATALLSGYVARAAVAAPPEIVVTPVRPTGLFKAGEPIEWKIEAKGEPAVRSARYSIKLAGMKPLAEGIADLSSGSATVRSEGLKEPGALLLEVTATPEGAPAGTKPLRALGGAAVAPEGIAPSAPRPADFDAFWDGKIREAAAVPLNPKEEAAPSNRENVEYYKVTLDNIRGTKIYGQLARPKKPGKYPALLIVQWAGVYGLSPNWVTDRANEGWLALNIMPHEQPFDKPAEFYKELAAGPLKDYTAIGNESRETSYFLRMFLSCYQAAEYLSRRPDWDGRTLVVTGGSQGGLQSVVTAGLHPKVTALMANVPAGCDVASFDAGRSVGWPYWQWQKAADRKKVMETARYFDAANFAPRVKCPALVGLGLIDETCPPMNVYSMVNKLGTAKKEVVVMPLSEHQEKNGSQRPFYERSWTWSQAILAGRPVPPTAK